MTKNLIARESWKIKDTEINYLVYRIEEDHLEYYEVEILHETFRLKRNTQGEWTGLDGEITLDIRKWGEVLDMLLKEKK